MTLQGSGRSRHTPPVAVIFHEKSEPAPEVSTEHKAYSLLPRIELSLAILITVIAVFAHVRLFTDSGALWRDEAVSADLAAEPSIANIWHRLQDDSFPLVWPLLLRGWEAIVGTHNDQGIRVLGLLIGLGLLATLWFHGLSTTGRPPLLALAFLALNSAVVNYGDSIRGYGLGLLTGILMTTMLWRAVKHDRLADWGLALLASLVAVHSIFHNSPFLLAACCGAASVLITRPNWKRAAFPIILGMICAASLLPYSLTLSGASRWVALTQMPMSLQWLWFKFSEAFSQTGTPAMYVWLATVALAFGTPLALLWPTFRNNLSPAKRDLMLFSSITLITGILAHQIFLWKLSYYMQPWYFLVTLTVAGISFDAIASAFVTNKTRWFPPLLAIALAMLCTGPLMSATAQSRTNVDAIAAEITANAGPDDLIVVSPWWLGHTFRREYAGPTPWMSVPPLPFPHDPAEPGLMGLKRQMQDPNDAMLPLLTKVRRALIDGHRVWITGELHIPPQGQHVMPAPDYNGDLKGWHDFNYYVFWASQLGEFIRDHATSLNPVDVKTPRPVIFYEDEPLFVVAGWHD